MEQEQQQEQQQPQQQQDAAFRSYNEARLKREATEGRCLLGFIVQQIVQQALAKETT